MKKIYSTFILLLFVIALLGQTRIFPPNLRAPVNGDVGLSPDVTLDWDAVTGQTTNITYELQLAKMADFSDAVTFERTDVTAIDMSELLFGETYFWRVKAFDEEEPSDWSEIWSFKVISTVNITDPDVGDEVYTTLEIKWDEISGLSKYELQIDTTYEWELDPSVTESDVHGAFILAENDQWLVGEGGLILHFDGTEWTTMDAGTTEDLNDVYFIDPANGFVVGDGGTVFNYDGSTWTQVDVGATGDLLAVSFIDADNGWIVGAEGAIYNYATGTWSAQDSGTSEDLNDVVGLNTNNVWACGNGDIVAHYDGTVWTTEEVGSKDYFSIYFMDENNGWIVGESGAIHYYNGAQWIEQESETNKDLFALGFNGMTGYAAGEDGVMVSYKGDWRGVATGTTENINAISLNGESGILGGDAGAVSVRTGEEFNSSYLKTIAVNSDTGIYEINNLLFGETIYYRMRAIHGMDTSLWTGGRSMITYPAPELDKPNNGSSDTDLMLEFEWDEYEGATEYTFQISLTEDFAEPIISFSDSTSTNYSMKYFGQDYFWRVNALHAEDVSDWSEVWSLTTINTVNLDSPEDEEIDVAACPSYEWEEIVGSSSYEIWIDKNEDFSEAAKEITEVPSFQCSSPLERKTVYYWKVRAITSLDTSGWSEVYSYKVEGFAGVGDDFTSGSVDIYPNPSDNGDVTITINSYASDIYTISIYDVTGKTVFRESIECRAGDNKIPISLTDKQKGLYMVNISKGEKAVTRKLFIR